MTKKQTTINDHFTPSPNRPTRTQGSSTRPRAVRRPSTPSEDSEGSEGLAAIIMTQKAPINRNLPISMKRTLKKAVYDSSDEEREAEERYDGEEVEEIATPKNKRASREGKNPKRREGVEAGISIPIGLKMGEGHETDDGDEEEEKPQRRGLRGRVQGKGSGQRKGKKVERDEDDEQDDEIVEITTPPRRMKPSQPHDSIIIDDDTAPGQSTETIPVPSPSPLPTEEVIQTPPPAAPPSPLAAKLARTTRACRSKALVPLRQVTDEHSEVDAPRRSGRNAASASKSPKVTTATLPVKAGGKPTSKGKANATNLTPASKLAKDVARPLSNVRKRIPSFVIDPPILSQEERVSYSRPSSSRIEQPVEKRTVRTQKGAPMALPALALEPDVAQQDQDHVTDPREVGGAEADVDSGGTTKQSAAPKHMEYPADAALLRDEAPDVQPEDSAEAKESKAAESDAPVISGVPTNRKSISPQDHAVSAGEEVALAAPHQAETVPVKSVVTIPDKTYHTAFGVNDINDDDLAILTDTEPAPLVTTDDDDVPIVRPPSSARVSNSQPSPAATKRDKGKRKASPSDDEDITVLSVTMVKDKGKKRQSIEDESGEVSQPVQRKSKGKKVAEDHDSPEQVRKANGKGVKRIRDDSDSPAPVRNGGNKRKAIQRIDSEVSSLQPSQRPVSEPLRRAVFGGSSSGEYSEYFDALFDQLDVPEKPTSVKAKNPTKTTTYGSKGKGERKGADSARRTKSTGVARPSKSKPTTKSTRSFDKPQRKATENRPKSKQTPKDKTADHASDDEDIQDIEMDEPERFRSNTRLRKRKETAFQRQIRKMKARRLGGEQPETESSGSESDGDTGDESEETSDSAPDTEDHDTDDFIVDDGGELEEGLLPHEFSLNSAQTPEFKFKVVFHYFVLLVVRGTGVLPLTGDTAEYLLPQLEDLRRRVVGYRDARVRSQIWRREFVLALEKFPEFNVQMLDFTQLGCDACHMSGRQSRYKVLLQGDAYDRETHEPVETDSEEEKERAEKKKRKAKKVKASANRKARGISTESDSIASSEEDEMPKEFMMGRFCERRSRCYHKMSHWEDVLYYRIKGHWHDLLRARDKDVPSDSDASSSEADTDEVPGEYAIRREARDVRRRATLERVGHLKRGNLQLPSHCRDVDQVTEWMDKQGYPNAEYHWMDNLIRESESLENDRSTDD